MRKTYLALALASVLLAGSVYAAEDRDAPPPPREESDMGWGHRGGGPGRHHGWEGRRGDDGDFRHRGPMGPGGPGHRRGGDFRGHKGFGFGPGMHMGMMGKGMGPMGMHHRMLTDLDLTADQKTKLLDALTQNYRERMEIMMDAAEARRDTRDLRDDDNASHDDIVAAHRSMGEIKGRMEVQDRKMRDEIKGILTPEQWERMDRGPRWDRDDDDAPRPFRDGKRPGPGPRK